MQTHREDAMTTGEVQLQVKNAKHCQPLGRDEEWFFPKDFRGSIALLIPGLQTSHIQICESPQSKSYEGKKISFLILCYDTIH